MSDKLRRIAAQVAAPGTDPEALVAVVTWSVGVRRHPDGLRRRLAEEDGQDMLQGLATSSDAMTPALRLAAVAGPPQRALWDRAFAVLSAWQRRNVRVSLVGDPAYPRKLAQGWPVSDAPTWLAWLGEPRWDAVTVAVVGARRASGYGTGIAAWLAEAAGDADVRVISGGALGIDAAAHEAALATRGATTVVLGCGHDVTYPRPHAYPDGLFERVVAAGGAIVSESLPDDTPRPYRIRARNRIVAGLADVVVVVEGGATSGALLTATAALERDRTVVAVPGDVRASGSVAPHRLLAEGAAPCTSPRDLLEVLSVSPASPPSDDEPEPSRQAVASCLPEVAYRVLAQRWPRPVPLPELAMASGLPVAVLMASVTRGKLSGELAENVEGLRLRRSPT